MSNLLPTQQVWFLGSSLDLSAGKIHPTPERVRDVVNCAILVFNRNPVEANQILRWLGLMDSLVDTLPLCRLHLRLLQLHLAAFYRPWFHPLDHLIPITGPV